MAATFCRFVGIAIIIHFEKDFLSEQRATWAQILNSELVLQTYTVVSYLFMHLVFSSYEPAQMSNWCKLIKRTEVHLYSSSADTLNLAEYGGQRITVCPFFAPSPQSVSSIVCCAHCVVNTLEMLEKVFQPLPSIVREERFCGAQPGSWSQVPTCDKHHLTWNHGTGNEIRKIISNPTPFTPNSCVRLRLLNVGSTEKPTEKVFKRESGNLRSH